MDWEVDQCLINFRNNSDKLPYASPKWFDPFAFKVYHDGTAATFTSHCHSGNLRHHGEDDSRNCSAVECVHYINRFEFPTGCHPSHLGVLLQLIFIKLN